MKRSIIVLVALFSLAMFFVLNVAFAAPVNSAFVDDEFYKCVVDAYNSDNNTSYGYDEILTDKQLNSITVLYCNENKYSISDITGVEKLTNLTNLVITNANLETVDLSRNFRLAVLNLNGNKFNCNSDLILPTSIIQLDILDNNIPIFDFRELYNLSKFNYSQIKDGATIAIVKGMNITVDSPNLEIFISDSTDESVVSYYDNTFVAEDAGVSKITLSNGVQLNVIVGYDSREGAYTACGEEENKDDTTGDNTNTENKDDTTGDNTDTENKDDTTGDNTDTENKDDTTGDNTDTENKDDTTGDNTDTENKDDTTGDNTDTENKDDTTGDNTDTENKDDTTGDNTDTENKDDTTGDNTDTGNKDYSDEDKITEDNEDNPQTGRNEYYFLIGAVVALAICFVAYTKIKRADV